MAQINYVRDLGIDVSHIDAHHNFHYSKAALPVLNAVLEETGITKVRRKPNFYCSWKTKAASFVWKQLVQFGRRNIKMTDYFGAVVNYIKYTKSGGEFRNECVLELMCHPGITKGFHMEENEFLINWSHSQVQLITYNDL